MYLKRDIGIIHYNKMWNYSPSIIYQYFPFALFNTSNFVPPYPITQTFPDISVAKVDIERPRTSSATACRQNVQINNVFTNLELRHRKAKKQAKCLLIKRKDREDCFEKKKQKKDRNLPSNICRFFVSFLYKHPNPSQILGPSKAQISEKILSCIKQVKKHIKKDQNYVRPSLIEAMCKGQLLGQAQSAIFRVLFKRFIRFELKIIISTMKKLKKKQKSSYFKLADKFLRHFIPQQ